MVQGEGWLARVARRFGEIVAGVPQRDRDEAAAVVEPRPTTAPQAGAVWTPNPPTLPAGVQIGNNGRYIVSGYSFSTLEQAASHAARTASAAAVPVPTAPPPPPVRVPPAGVPTRSGPSPSRWIGEPSTFEIGTRTVTAELVYFGTPVSFEPKHDKSRIDPSLPIDPRGDPHGTTLTYWQSYAGLDPRARWTYLDWLESGRSDPAIPIGYVFVFFYGLEQRLLADDARDEAQAIFAEVRRLVAIYGENYSFESYAGKLLTLAVLYEPEDRSPPTAASTRNYDLELPLDLRVRLGRRLRDDQPFDADDALHWVLALPDVFLRTPGQRCFDELLQLWRVRFADRSPNGLRVRKPRSSIRFAYRAASGAFSTALTVDIPDISGTSAPLAPLRAMLDTCMEELSAYSRLLGRDPEARGRLRGDLLLPAELRQDCASLGTCRTFLSPFAQSAGLASIPAAELARALDIEVEPGAEKLPAALIRQIGVALDALDLGCEPDRRYGPSTALRADGRLCIFDAKGGGAVEHERPAYAAARAMVEVAMLAAMSDGEVAPVEHEAIERRLRTTPDLAEHEIARLLACGRALAADPPKVRAALKKLAEVAPGRRAALASSAVEAVLADGRVLPDEVRFLEALHAALDLPTGPLYSALHRSGEDVGLVEVVAASVEGLVPLPPEAPSVAGAAIDITRLERIRGETTQVSAMLAAIFTDDEPEPLAPAPKKAPEAPSAFEGLDSAHAALLTRLLSGPIERSEFDAAAGALRLMPDGAIEALNEWGFDRFGEPVVEDDDEIRIVPEILHQLEPMGVAA